MDRDGNAVDNANNLTKILMQDERFMEVFNLRFHAKPSLFDGIDIIPLPKKCHRRRMRKNAARKARRKNRKG